MKTWIRLLLIYILNVLPIQKNKIIFFSYYGSQYGCNPRYITEYILKNYPPEKFDIVWAFHNTSTRSELTKVRQVKMMSLQYFYELCTAKVIITNYRTTDLFVKRKQQYYIQTWHSSLRLKQIEKDAENTLPKKYVQMAKKDSLKCDLLLSGCQLSTNIFKHSFWYTGEIFKHGTPRNDLFFQRNSTQRKATIEKLSLSNETKFLLYAPTFRNNDDLKVYDLDYEQLRTALKERFGGEWMILVRLHPHLLPQADQIIHGQKVINVTNYDDIQELMLLADVLISDYSSLIFDFSITKRPCFLYVPDLETYQKSERKLYFNVPELPFIHSTSNEDLFNQIMTFDEISYTESLKMFLQKIGSYEEGNASKHLMQRINNICFNHEEGEIDEAI